MINEICVKLLNIFQQCAIFAPNVSQCTWTVVEFSEMFNLHPRAGSSGLTPFDYTEVVGTRHLALLVPFWGTSYRYTISVQGYLSEAIISLLGLVPTGASLDCKPCSRCFPLRQLMALEIIGNSDPVGITKIFMIQSS